MDTPSPEMPPWLGVCGATINSNGTSEQVPRLAEGGAPQLGSATSVANANVSNVLLLVMVSHFLFPKLKRPRVLFGPAASGCFGQPSSVSVRLRFRLRHEDHVASHSA